MAWAFVAHRGNALTKVSGATLAVNPTATLVVGAVVIVRCAADNLAAASGETTEHSVADSKGNTWTKMREHCSAGGGAALGVTISTFVSQITVELLTSDTITLTVTSAVSAKVIAIEEFSIGAGNTVTVTADEGGIEGGGANNYSISLSGLASTEYLFFGHVGFEASNIADHVLDTDYGNNLEVDTTGGAANSNVASHMGTRIATLTGDTFAGTTTFAYQIAATLVALLEVSSGVDLAAGLSAEAISPTQVELYWLPDVPAGSTTEIYRGPCTSAYPTGYTLLDTVGVAATRYTDITAEPDTCYNYVIVIGSSNSQAAVTTHLECANAEGGAPSLAPSDNLGSGFDQIYTMLSPEYTQQGDANPCVICAIPNLGPGGVFLGTASVVLDCFTCANFIIDITNLIELSEPGDVITINAVTLQGCCVVRRECTVNIDVPPGVIFQLCGWPLDVGADGGECIDPVAGGTVMEG